MYNFKRNVLNFVGDMIFLIKIPNRLPFDVFEFGLPEGFTLRSWSHIPRSRGATPSNTRQCEEQATVTSAYTPS